MVERILSRLFIACLLCFALMPAEATQWPTETHPFSNIAATPSAFTLFGGAYAVTIHAGTWGTVTLQRRAADGSTFVTALTAFSADGFATTNLPPGTYQLAVSGASGVYADVTSIIVNK